MKLLLVHPDAVKDLEKIRLVDHTSYTRILALLQQVKKDPVLRSRLKEHGYRDPIGDRIDVKKWHLLQRNAQDAWRIRLPDLEQYGVSHRIVYAFKGQAATVHLLAIVDRAEIDYDSIDHPFSGRILRALASL